MAAKRKIMVPYPVLKEGLTELFERYEVYYPNRIVPRQEILDVLPQYDALISCGFLANAEAIEHMDNVKVMSTYGVGYDNVDLKKMNEKGILVCNLPDIVTESTAEFAMGLMLGLMRRIPETDHIFIQRDLLFIKGSPAEKAIDTTGAEDICYIGERRGSGNRLYKGRIRPGQESLPGRI